MARDARWRPAPERVIRPGEGTRIVSSNDERLAALCVIAMCIAGADPGGGSSELPNVTEPGTGRGGGRGTGERQPSPAHGAAGRAKEKPPPTRASNRLP